ncbi:MAG TPA: hypothetical protein VMC80_01205 [Patescibacteria group bacterium]|nr:hypothetical protein [Patescibacteria group bacterium]
MNKHGWIEIVEAFVSILLITGVLLIVITRNNSQSSDISDRVYNSEITIIREIQLNDTLSGDVLSVTDAQLPSDWTNSSFPPEIKSRIISRTPNYLNCTAKICDPGDPCYLSTYEAKDVYSQDSIISAISTQTAFNPRKLKLFCWER